MPGGYVLRARDDAMTLDLGLTLAHPLGRYECNRISRGQPTSDVPSEPSQTSHALRYLLPALSLSHLDYPAESALKFQ